MAPPNTVAEKKRIHDNFIDVVNAVIKRQVAEIRLYTSMLDQKSQKDALKKYLALRYYKKKKEKEDLQFEQLQKNMEHKEEASRDKKETSRATIEQLVTKLVNEFSEGYSRSRALISLAIDEAVARCNPSSPARDPLTLNERIAMRAELRTALTPQPPASAAMSNDEILIRHFKAWSAEQIVREMEDKLSARNTNLLDPEHTADLAAMKQEVANLQTQHNAAIDNRCAELKQKIDADPSISDQEVKDALKSDALYSALVKTIVDRLDLPSSTDHRITPQYNMAIAQQRAEAILRARPAATATPPNENELSGYQTPSFTRK
jgi:hypothetical protein